MRRDSGQATLEMTLAFPILVALFGLLIWGGGGGWAVFWMDYQLQDAVLCLNDSSVSRCRARFEPLIKQGTAFVHFQSLTLRKGGNELYGKINFTFPFSGKTRSFQIEKKIQLPIVSAFGTNGRNI